MQPVRRYELQSLVSAANYEKEKMALEKRKMVARGLVERVIAPEVMRLATGGHTELTWDASVTEEGVISFVYSNLCEKFPDCAVEYLFDAKKIVIRWD